MLALFLSQANVILYSRGGEDEKVEKRWKRSLHGRNDGILDHYGFNYPTQSDITAMKTVCKLNYEMMIGIHLLLCKTYILGCSNIMCQHDTPPSPDRCD